MKSDDDDSPHFPGSGSGLSTIRNREPRKNGDDPINAQVLKTVRLVCLYCREVRIIHIPVHCDTPKDVLWECLTCQERWASRR